MIRTRTALLAAVAVLALATMATAPPANAGEPQVMVLTSHVPCDFVAMVSLELGLAPKCAGSTMNSPQNFTSMKPALGKEVQAVLAGRKSTSTMF